MEAKKDGYWFMEKKEYTVDDIMALPEGVRAELFDGEMVMLATPTVTHQLLLNWFNVEIAIYIRNKGGNCLVLPAPFGVFIRKDNRNYYEPDVSVICDRDKLDEKGCHGGPDWVIEILSPSSRKYDCGKKLSTYIDVGVREYWIADPEKCVVVVYRLEKTDIPEVYPFGETIKAGIFEDLELTVPKERLY